MAYAERERESSGTASPADSSSADNQRCMASQGYGSSPGSTSPDHSSPGAPSSPPLRRPVSRLAQDGPRDEDADTLSIGEWGVSTPSASVDGDGRVDRGESVADGEEETGLVTAPIVEAAWTPHSPLDGHLCSMLIQDDGSRLAYLYCKHLPIKNPSLVSHD